MISLNEKEITQIYRDDSLVEYIYKGDRPIYDCMIDYVLNDDGTCYVNRAGPIHVARQENIEYLYIPNKICKNSRIYEVTKVGTRDGYNNKFRILKKALIGAPTDESGKMAIVDYGFEDRTSLEEVVITDSVFSIGKGAFLGCNKIAKMTLPPCAPRLDRIFGNQVDTSTGELVPQSLKTVTIHSNRETFKRLQDRFFYKCSYIETINIDIKNLESIGDNAFEGCSKLKNITIPDSVTSIGNSAFYGCSGLTSITIPDSVTSIGDDAFFGCDNLKYNGYDNGYYLGNSNNQHVALIKAKDISIASCKINENTKTICPNAFDGCSGLTNVTIPDSVISIGKEAFRDCSRLTSVTIGNGVTSIGAYAFDGCIRLTNVTIPDSVTEIGYAAFAYCDNLQYNEYYNGYYLGNSNNQHVALIKAKNTSISACKINGNTKIICSDAFRDCSGLTDITIPNSVTSIGDYAFQYCSGLTSVTIPDSVTSIGFSAFGYCSKLTSVYITDIAAWCKISFSDFSSNPLCYARNLYLNNELVTELTIPDSVTSIGSYAFYYCYSLTSITIPDSVTYIDSWAFAYSGLKSVAIPNSVASIGDLAFSGCDVLTSATIGGSVTSIGDSVFSHCSSLKSVTIGNSVTSIGHKAFWYCSKLTSVTIPNSVTSIGEWAFSNSGLTSVTIPDSVTSIGEYAFLDCSSLISVTIGNSVTSIGKWAFRDCSGLTNVIMLPTNPPTLGSGAIPSNVTTITVPVGCSNTYKTAAGWSAYANKIVEATA